MIRGCLASSQGGVRHDHVARSDAHDLVWLDSLAGSHPLDDPPGYAGGPGDRKAVLRVSLARRGFYTLPPPAAVHRHGGRGGRARRWLYDLRIAQEPAAHP